MPNYKNEYQAPSFNLKEISLVSAIFQQKGEKITDSEEINLNIKTHYNNEQPLASVFLIVDVSIADADKATTKLEGSVTYKGIFEIVPAEADSDAVMSFLKINAPAILYPFVREYYADISSRANIGRLLLPPINFVKMAEENK